MIAAPVDAVYSSLTRPTVLMQRLSGTLDSLPPEAREHLSEVSLDDSGVTFNSPMGPVRLAIVPAECVENSRVVYRAAQSPVAFALIVDLEPEGEGTLSQSSVEVDLPFFLRSMVGGKLRDGAVQMGKVLAHLPYTDDALFG